MICNCRKSRASVGGSETSLYEERIFRCMGNITPAIDMTSRILSSASRSHESTKKKHVQTNTRYIVYVPGISIAILFVVPTMVNTQFDSSCTQNPQVTPHATGHRVPVFPPATVVGGRSTFSRPVIRRTAVPFSTPIHLNGKLTPTSTRNLALTTGNAASGLASAR